MADDVLREFLVSILSKFDESSNKQALDAVDKQQDQITDKEKKGQVARGKNLAGALGEATKQVAAHSKAVLQFGEKVALGLAGIITSVEGAAVAGTFALAKLSGEMKAAYYSGQKLGAAVKDMEAFKYASEQAGSSAAKAQAGLEELGHLRNTNPAAYVGLLQRLGVAATDAAGKLRSPAQAAMDLAPALAKLPRNMQLLFGNQLGMDDDQTLAMVRPEFLAQIQQYKDIQKAIGFDPDKAAADGAKFQQIWTKMWAAVDIVSKKVQTSFFNQVGGSVDRITDLLVKNSGRITDAAIKVGGYVLHLATSIVDLVGNFDKLNPTTQRFIEVMAGVAAVLLTLRAGPIGIIMALAAALSFLWDDYEKYKDGLPSVVDWEKWEPKIKAAIKGLTDLWTKFDQLSLKLTGQGGLQVAMEAFAAYMATSWVTKLVGAFTTVSKAWAPLAAMLTAAGYLANNTGSNVDPWADQSAGETAMRAAEPGLADRVYGKRGEQLPHGPHHGIGTKAQPHDDRTLWQRRPQILGGKPAPERHDPEGTPEERLRKAAKGSEKAAPLPPERPHSLGARLRDRFRRGGGESSIAVSKDLPPEARALLDTIAGTESPGYNVEYGGKRFGTYADHPREGHVIKSGPNAGRTSNAAGRYQFLSSTWDRIAKTYGLKDFSPANQDKAAWYLAQEDYKARTGRDLNTDLKSSDPNMRAGIGRALSGTWTSLPGGIEAGTNVGKFSAAYDRNLQKQARSADQPPALVSIPIGDQAALDAQNRIAAGKARAGDAAIIAEHRRQQNTPASEPTPKPVLHPDDDRESRARASDVPSVYGWRQSPVQHTKSSGANALTKLYGSGLLSQGGPSLYNPLMASPSSLYRAYDGGAKPSAAAPPQVNQNINIHGIQNPKDIEHHLKTHAKRGVQDAIRHMQGPSQ